MGSDAHDIGSLKAVVKAWEVVARLGLSADCVWRPSYNPMAGPDRAENGRVSTMG